MRLEPAVGGKPIDERWAHPNEIKNAVDEGGSTVEMPGQL